MTKLKADEAVLGLAAAVTGRACELIQDGWTKGKMRGGEGGVESFCVHGAVELAMEEIFGIYDRRQLVQQDVEDVAVAFLCDEAFGQMQSGRIPVASFNDAASRKHSEVIGVMSRAADRLWDLSSDSEPTQWTPSKWSTEDLEKEEVKNFLYGSLN